jgi:hypothetical protein
VSVTNQIKKYLHALLFIAFAVVIISAIGYLINTIPERTISIGEREETYTEAVPVDIAYLYSVRCESYECVFYEYPIPANCYQAQIDYSEATSLPEYWIRVHNGIDVTYTVEPGSIFILNHTGVLVDFNLGEWETIHFYCVYAEYVTHTTTIPGVKVSSKDLLSFVYFAVTILIVLTGIRKFLPQF